MATQATREGARGEGHQLFLSVRADELLPRHLDLGQIGPRQVGGGTRYGELVHLIEAVLAELVDSACGAARVRETHDRAPLAERLEHGLVGPRAACGCMGARGRRAVQGTEEGACHG